MAVLAIKERDALVRPLRDIEADISAVMQDIENAAAPYRQRLADLFAEARDQMSYSAFLSWAHRKYKIGENQANRYLSAGRFKRIYPRARDSDDVSLSDTLRRAGQSPRGAARGGVAWHDPVKEAADRAVHFRNLHEESLKKAEERDLKRKLKTELIKIGYRVLAAKLHPDKKDGSTEAMARLVECRDELLSCI